MTPKQQNANVYNDVRQLIQDLLENDGVLGVVLLDRDGRLVLHEGPEPRGDVEGLANSFLRQARAAATVRAMMGGSEPSPAFLVRDKTRSAYIMSCGRGTSLLVYVADVISSGLWWRIIDRQADRLATLLGADGGETATGEAETRRPIPDASSSQREPSSGSDDPIWDEEE